MKYRALIIFILLLFPYYVLAQEEQNKTLLLIKQKDQYTQQKERKIKEAINLLRVPNAMLSTNAFLTSLKLIYPTRQCTM